MRPDVDAQRLLPADDLRESRGTRLPLGHPLHRGDADSPAVMVYRGDEGEHSMTATAR